MKIDFGSCFRLCRLFDQRYFKELLNTALVMVDAFKFTKLRIEIIMILADDNGYAVSELLEELKKNKTEAANLSESLNTMEGLGFLVKRGVHKSNKINKDVNTYYLEQEPKVFTAIVKDFIRKNNIEYLKKFLGSAYTNSMISKNPGLQSKIPEHFLSFTNFNCNASSSSPNQSNSLELVNQTESKENKGGEQSILPDNATSSHPSLQAIFDTTLKLPIYRHMLNDILINLRDICQNGLKKGTFGQDGKKKIALLLMDTAVYDMNEGATKILDVLHEIDIVLYTDEEGYKVSDEIYLVNARETLFDIIEMLNVRDRPILDKCVRFILDGLIAENERDNLIEEEHRNFESLGPCPEMSHPVGTTHYRVGRWIAKDPNQKKELIDKVNELVLSSPEAKGYGIKFITHIL